MDIEVETGQQSVPGPRAANEDFAALALPPAHEPGRGLVVAIADGVSSGGAGREAARVAVRGLVADFHAAAETWDTSVVLDRLIGALNSWLFDHNRRREGTRAGAATGGLALTTLTALVLRGPGWTVAHVGDTRAWLVRDGQCVQLTEDHAYRDSWGPVRLTRAVGLDDRVRVDYEHGEARAGDVFVLTSDGVHGVLARERIAALATDGSADAASAALVRAALAAGSRDDATAVVVRVHRLFAGRFEDRLPALRELPAPPRLAAGDLLDGYRIDALVADNGVHRVYRAHARDGRAVVLKALHEGRGADLQERAMLAHEVWLAERLAVQGARPGEAAFVRPAMPAAPSAHYAVFEWHEGRTLDELLADGASRFEIAEIVDAAIAIARALGRLHRQGVIHRDIKPANLHRGADGRWRILDLGAALSGSDPAPLRWLRAGTPSYMPPERWQDRDGEAAAAATDDLYALGVTLYLWLTRRLPYGVVEPFQTGRFRRDPKPPSRLRPEVPIWLDQVVLQAVALDARRRFETAEELVVALERGAARPSMPHPRTPLAARDPTALWKLGLAASLLLNALLVYWLLFLPR